MPRPLSRVELRLGLDCALKLRYARAGLPHKSAGEEHPLSIAGARELVVAHYWACHAPVVDARKATGAWLRRLLARAVTDARSTGSPVRVRGATFRAGDAVSCAEELVVHPDRWEMAEIHPKRMPESPAELRTRAGVYLSKWRPLVEDLELARQIVARWVDANGPAIEVAPDTPVQAQLIGLRENPGSSVSRSLTDFRLGIGADGTHRVSTKSGTRSEGEATFQRLLIPPEPLGYGIDTLVELARTKEWPEPKDCFAVRCKTCEFNLPGDPDSGFARCWGSEAVYRPDHILRLKRLSESQLAAAVARDGPSATFGSINPNDIRDSQKHSVAAEGTLRISEELDRWARERREGLTDSTTNPREPQAHFLSVRGASVPLPAWPGAQPYEVVPFQFSAHALPTEASSLEDRVFLPGFVRCDLGDPRREFVDALRAQVTGDGPVFHWHHFERVVLRRIRNSIHDSLAAQTSIDGDLERVAFIDGLVGANDQGGGRLIDLLPIAAGYAPPIRAFSLALPDFVRHAWRYERISRAFQASTSPRADPTVYADPVDPAYSLPLAPPVPSDAESSRREGRPSPFTPGAAAELWLQLRTGARQDYPAVHATLRAWGHLRSGSVLIAHHFLVHVAPALARQAADRTVRVFVSSTFRDFREERNLLKQEVEPTLNQRAEDRMVQVTIVDLRWGITSEQANRGLTLPVCLGEVVRCRPHFIGLLGERYGWVPPAGAFGSVVVESMPWLKDHIGGSSVTELEIRHGALDASVDVGDARFYFRDPAFAAGKGRDFVSVDLGERHRLGVLKQAIRDRGFSVCDGYPDPRAFATRVTEDLWARIDAAYPRDLVGDAALEDWTAHQSHAARLLRNHQPDDDSIRALRGRLTDRSTRRIIISGTAGSGKSSFIVKALEAYVGSTTMVPIVHFVGVGRTSTTLSDITRRIVRTSRRLLGVSDEAGETRSAAESVASLRALGAAATRRGATLVIAIDGLDAVDQLESFEWLHGALPDGVKLVMTALRRGPLVQAPSMRRGSWRMPMAPLDQPRARAMMAALLAWQGRTLPEAQLAAILAHPCASSPGFLCRLLDELTMSADHESILPRLGQCLRARSLAGLHDVILRRIESEFGKAFVANAMRFLIGKRAGVAESELVSALDNRQAEVSALRLHMGQDLVDAAGRISIRPGAFAEAVRRRYPVSS